jgi:hypothetical protein
VDDPALPSISDYWPVAPHRIGPPADHYTEDPQTAEEWAAAGAAAARGPLPVTAPPAPTPAPAPVPAPPAAARPRRRGWSKIPFALAGLLLAGSAATAVVVLTRPGRTPTAAIPAPVPSASRAPEQQQQPPPAQKAPAQLPPTNVVSGTVGDRTEATFEMVDEVVTFRLRTGPLGDDLYRVSTPQDNSVLPFAELEEDGVRVRLARSGRNGNSSVDVVLNERIRWDLRLSGGIRRGTVDLGSGRIAGVDLRGGATRLDLVLPPPDGTLPVRMTGGINRFTVRTADGVPVRVRTRRGAGQVVLNGRTDDGVAKGASFLSPDWSKSADRIDLDAVGGIGTLKVSAAAGDSQ